MNLLDIFTMYMIANAQLEVLITLCDDFSTSRSGQVVVVNHESSQVGFLLEEYEGDECTLKMIAFTIPEDATFENYSHGDGYIAFEVAEGYRVKIELPDLNTVAVESEMTMTVEEVPVVVNPASAKYSVRRVEGASEHIL